jgi:phosphoribosylaminoimidazolecarboxamide formyltransferase / IMP cyclohydrolase
VTPSIPAPISTSSPAATSTSSSHPGLKKIRRALLSVTDKSGLVDFARKLSEHSVELVSTGGTARKLRESGLTVLDISELTGFPEMLDGRVKTLHPKVHGGILHIRENSEHRAAVENHGIQPIDMVVVNLYAFEKTASRAGATFAEVIENIDIGGPSMVRSAAKNFEDVAVVTSAADYSALAEELHANNGSLTRETRWRLARSAFALTAAYDTAIANTLEQLDGVDAHAPLKFYETAEAAFPSTLRLSYPLAMPLRYGENPHQRAALYNDQSGTGVAGAQQLQGKELSYNNLVDLDACWELIQEFDQTAVAIIKHTNPAGTAIGRSVAEAYQRTLAADPISAFGGVIGVNREVDADAAEEIAKLFVEAVAAPGYTPEALARFAGKKNLRLIAVNPGKTTRVIKQVSGGLLLQDADGAHISANDLKVVTARKPTEAEIQSLPFAWRVCKHVKSNAIVYARDGQTLGVGAGQMSRVDSAKFGAMKAVLPLANCVAASDAFFPFADGLEAVAAAGATAVIQPGGSVRDEEVIAAADKLGVAMVFTGIRHFRH